MRFEIALISLSLAVSGCSLISVKPEPIAERAMRIPPIECTSVPPMPRRAPIFKHAKACNYAACFDPDEWSALTGMIDAEFAYDDAVAKCCAAEGW
jgi:hypothetical protein